MSAPDLAVPARLSLLIVHDDPATLEVFGAAFGGLPSIDSHLTLGSATALHWAAHAESPPDAVLTLRTLEGQSSIQMLESLRERNPHLAAALLSDDPAFGEHRPWLRVLPSQPLPLQQIMAWLSTLADDKAHGPERLGDYDLHEIVAEAENRTVYRATQRSVGRTVALERLNPQFLADLEAVERFCADVRAKASIVHPHMAPVYETQQLGDAVFFTRELINGQSLPELLRSGVRLSQETILHLLETAAEVVRHLDHHRVGRRAITPKDVILGADGLPRLTNFAVHSPSVVRSDRDEIVPLMQSAFAVLDATRPAAELRGLVERLRDRQAEPALFTWAGFAAAIADAQRQAAGGGPPATQQLSAGTYNMVMRRRRKKRYIVMALVGAAALAWILIMQGLPYLRAPKARDFSDLVRIGPGTVTGPDGAPSAVKEFWIGKYEVTIGQYAAFLEHLKAYPGAGYDHPNQPSTKTTHQPVEWEEYYRQARRAGSYHGLPVDLNCPMTMVDLWDAWAYARWKEARLPTDAEWEWAGRGEKNHSFPWGTTDQPGRANTGADYAEPGKGSGGSVDGFGGWCAVDAKPQDATPAGVVGMAGNVSEWTASTMPDADRLNAVVPILRGGNFFSPSADSLARKPAKSPEYSDRITGFRIVFDSPPPP